MNATHCAGICIDQDIDRYLFDVLHLFPFASRPFFWIPDPDGLENLRSESRETTKNRRTPSGDFDCKARITTTTGTIC
jgi:hypothetical protein